MAIYAFYAAGKIRSIVATSKTDATLRIIKNNGGHSFDRWYGKITRKQDAELKRLNNLGVAPKDLDSLLRYIYSE